MPIVLTGAGDRAFCAGADLGGIAENAGAAAVHDARGLLAALFRAILDLLFQILDLGRNLFHRHLCRNRALGQGIENKTYDNRENDNGNADIVRGDDANEKYEPIVERIIDGRVEDGRNHRKIVYRIPYFVYRSDAVY